MARKVKYLLERHGRFYARMVIPPRLRPHLDHKTELLELLGGDFREATKAIHAAVAKMQYRLRQAEIDAADAGRPSMASAPYLLSKEQIALRNYRIRLQFDADLRALDHRHASGYVDEHLIAALKRGFSGAATDEELALLVGVRINYFTALGNTAALPGTKDWRELAIALCASEYEALARVAERDEGDFAGEPTHPTLTSAEPVLPDLPPVSLSGLFDDYIESRKLLGKASESERRWDPVFKDLRRFLKHDDARRLTKKDVLQWRDHLLETRSAKTVRDVWLASLRAVLNWAVREDRLSENVAANVRQDVQRRRRVRESGFTKEEATRILKASRTYQPSGREAPQLAAAKNWVPLLAAFTGARVTELTQLRKQDILRRDGRYVIRITPDAGSVKTGQFRDVPIHTQIVDEGFLDFVEQAPVGPLFFKEASCKSLLSGARTVSGRLSVWLNGLGVIPQGVQPNHGWRHRFKTLGRELGYSDRVVDAICGHSSRTTGDDYGDVTIEARARVIDALARYDF